MNFLKNRKGTTISQVRIMINGQVISTIPKAVAAQMKLEHQQKLFWSVETPEELGFPVLVCYAKPKEVDVSEFLQKLKQLKLL